MQIFIVREINEYLMGITVSSVSDSRESKGIREIIEYGIKGKDYYLLLIY